MLSQEQKALLKKARETYGDSAQILVSVEELCELASVCSKYPRYENKTKAREELNSKVIDEVADVTIVLDHIINIFDLDLKSIDDRIAAKLARLQRWLKASTSMEQTTVDRKVSGVENPEKPCKKCMYYIEDYEYIHDMCKTCGKDFRNFKVTLPCNRCIHMGNWKNLAPEGTCTVCRKTGGSKF